ncbi:MAG: TetR/AcrR family transcriptional regulator [Solobacterium sp.]|nr:TetR/AcrR family transcriptional regulator [Solobacterium sp.]
MPIHQDPDTRREEFVDAAEKLFKQNGIVETTINAIVKEMDVAKGLFYYYFKSKDDVIDAISQKYSEAFEKTIGKTLKEDSFEDRIQQFIKNVIVSFKELWDNLHGEKEEIDLTLLASRSMEDAKAMASNLFEKLLEEGIESDKIEIKNPRYFADLMISGIVDLVHQSDVDLNEVEEMINEIIAQTRKESNHHE